MATLDEFKKAVGDFEAAVSAQVEKYGTYQTTQAALTVASAEAATAVTEYNTAKDAATAAKDALVKASSDLL